MPKPKKRKGMSMIETIGSLVLLSLLMVVVGRLSMAKVQDSLQLDAQYAILAADGWLADIYRDFHAAQEIRYVEELNGDHALYFTMPDALETVYAFSEQTQICYTNGVPQFRALSFTVIGTPRNMDISVKLPMERVLSINIYE